MYKDHSTRKQFLQQAVFLMTAAFAGTAFDFKKNIPLLSFSTLGCPDWSFLQIVNFAKIHHYQGIEIRGILREMDLPRCPEFSEEQIAATLQLMKERNLKFSGLGSSASLHYADSMERIKNIAEAKRFIDLAQKINCPYVRVFPNKFPPEQDKKQTIDLIIKGLTELGDYAKNKNVKVLMETHGDLVHTDDIEKIMQAAAHPHVGLVWDICNMWIITKEPPAEVYHKLKKYIHHTHIKDAKLKDGKIEYVLLGKGDVPAFEAIDLLAADGYTGYYSFEWEKLWHPEILEPEIALADFPDAIKKHFNILD
jgi:sugar phosphate isomerase/epimerase